MFAEASQVDISTPIPGGWATIIIDLLLREALHQPKFLLKRLGRKWKTLLEYYPWPMLR